MRPGSATSLPDSTTSTGLLCLSVGAHEHCGRSDIEVDCVATTMCISHSAHDTYMGGYVHMYTKYEVSMSNPVPREVCTDDDDANDKGANEDEQSMIVKALWLINQMSQKLFSLKIQSMYRVHVCCYKNLCRSV